MYLCVDLCLHVFVFKHKLYTYILRYLYIYIFLPIYIARLPRRRLWASQRQDAKTPWRPVPAHEDGDEASAERPDGSSSSGRVIGPRVGPNRLEHG